MNTAKDSIRPSPAEIEVQLSRILASKGFANSEQRSDLLEYLVRQTLEGKSWKEAVVCGEVFPSYPTESRIVSIVATAIRKQLAQYYAVHHEDAITIDLPRVKAGTLYHATFSYRRNPEALGRYELGVQCASSDTLNDQSMAARHFAKATELEPTFALAHAARAESELYSALLSGLDKDGDSPNQIDTSLRMSTAEAAAQAAIRCDSELWQARIVSAAVHACRFEWAEAEAEFEIVQRRAPAITQKSLIYATYLVAIGRAEEAMGIVERRIAAAPLDQLNHAIHALLQYALRRPLKYPSHESNLRTHWLYQLVSELVDLRDTREMNWDSGIYGNLNCHDVPFHLLGVPQFGEVRLKAAPGFFYREIPAGASISELGTYISEALANYIWTQPLQLSIAYLALSEIAWHGGIPAGWCLVSLPQAWMRPASEEMKFPICQALRDRAIASLSKACDQGDPAMALLHLWPFFDGLRNEPNFKELIHRLNLPRSVPGEVSETT